MAKPSKEQTTSRSCETCEFFVKSTKEGSNEGRCHRFPDTRAVATAFWCGEWKQKPE